jgi:hypothetical protein
MAQKSTETRKNPASSKIGVASIFDLLGEPTFSVILGVDDSHPPLIADAHAFGKRHIELI